MVTGRNLFARESGPESMSAVLTEVVAPADEIRDGVSPPWHASSSTVSRNHRSPVSDGARPAVRARVGECRVQRARSRETSPVVSPAPRRSMRGLALAGVAAVAGLALGWWGGSTRNARHDAPEFPRVTKFAATDAAEFAPALSPDGKWIAYHGFSDTERRLGRVPHRR